MFEKIKLKNLVDLRAGIGFPNKYQGNKNGNIPFYKVGDISREFQKCNFYINNADNYITAEILAELKGKLFDEGTIIFAKVGEALKLNRRIILTQKAMIDNNIFGIKSNNPRLNNKYLFYFLLQYDLGNICKTGAVPSVNQSDIYSISIPLPSTLEEQQEIVDVLDAASEIIRLRTACIESAQALIPALFQEMFGDPLSKVDKNKIGYYFDVGTGATPRRENSEYYEGNIPWVKTTEVDNCYINSTSEHISESAVKETNCSLYPPGTILMAMYGQGKTRGKVAYLNISATTNQACAALQLKKEYENYVNLIYVFYYLQIIYEFLRTLSQGGGRPNMNLSIVRNIPLYLPDIKQQELFAEKVQEIEAYIKTQQAELENAKTMFQSLLHHSFTGELTRHKFGGDANG